MNMRRAENSVRHHDPGRVFSLLEIFPRLSIPQLSGGEWTGRFFCDLCELPTNALYPSRRRFYLGCVRCHTALDAGEADRFEDALKLTGKPREYYEGDNGEWLDRLISAHAV